MEQIYKQFVHETFNQNGKLVELSFDYPENYNFGFDVVDVLAERYPDKKAMIWLSREKEEKIFSFSDISKESNRAVNLFKKHGINKGDVVMLIMKRHHQFWPVMVALHKIGAIAVPATFLLTKKDLVYRFNAAGVRAVICTGDGNVADAVNESLSESPTVELCFSVNSMPREGWIDFDTAVKQESDVHIRPTGDEDPKADEIMLMYFTSGTTGYPRIAAHSHTYALGHIVTAVHWHNAQRDGIHLTISDTGWGKSVWGKLYGQWMAETCIFTYDFDKFEAKDILSTMSKYKITTFCAPPTMYRFFIQEDLSQFDLSSLVYLTTAGEALNPEVFRRVKESVGIEIMEGFGQTETTLTICNLKNSKSVSVGSMGKPSPQYKLLLVDAEGNHVDPGVVGEIAVDTSEGTPVGMFRGYFNDPESTARVWHDGLYHTGDMAWADENGNFWFVGRTDDLIKSSGYRISPFEIESVLMEHTAVMECAVTGIPDEVRGQVIKATIKLAPGFTGTDDLAEDIKRFVKKLTAPYKYPRLVEFVDELPKTISGKIRRVEIRENDQSADIHQPVSAPATTYEILQKNSFSDIIPLIQALKESQHKKNLTRVQLTALEAAVRNEDIQFFAARSGMSYVGVCSVAKFFSTYGSAETGIFDDFFIPEVYRHKGIARGLVNFVFSEMQKQGISSLRVGSERDHDMYHTLGFSTQLGSLLVWNQ